MKPETLKDSVADEVMVENDPRFAPPLSWRIGKFLKAVWLPAVLVLAVLGWIFIPQLEARNQQSALATQFFAECEKTLKDTEQLPKVPDECLADAIKEVPITAAALHDWSPQVTSEVKDKQWIAKIQFSSPGKYSVEQTIGPAHGEAGYDTPSPGP